ncbi:MAG: DNA mismatch repair protein [Polyangiaceae bacterium]
MTGVTMTSAWVPDLLQPNATSRIDAEQTKFALNLAFAGSSAGGMFAEALDRASMPASTWDPSLFAKDMFLQRVASQYFRVVVGAQERTVHANYLLRLLSHPPSDPATILFRRDILAELVRSPELRKALEGLYGELSRLRALLENSGASRVYDANRQRLDTLGAAKRIFDGMARDFTGATSGLARLSELGAAIQATEPYQSLRDLLAYDAQLATLNLKVTVGADGRIRGFDVLAIDENAENPFVASKWRRWLARFELFVRGYRFSQDEIMARLVDAVFSGLDDKIVMLIQLLGDVEFYLGALGFRDKAESAGLAVCLPELGAPNERRELRGLFNPLLLLGGVTPVPCDLVVEPTTSTTLVTGPNSGGKTRLLQSIGLSQLLAQCGLFVPARSGRVAMASGLVASLIEGTEADQTEGRLGMELLRIRALFERLPPNAVVLLDELCSGTNPSEGERIFELVLGMLHKLGPQAFITTHFLLFAQNLEAGRKVPGLSFLQVEIDGTRRATYQFVPGVAKTSLAEHVAERLGVTGDQLLGLIEANLRKWRPPAPPGGS